MKCPVCKKEVAPGNPEAPFCSARCRTIDLGNWSAERYVIPGAPGTAREEDEEDE
jgi:endogenous inhibitor of DNA gyrase (YacG/DUF329 family)